MKVKNGKLILWVTISVNWKKSKRYHGQQYLRGYYEVLLQFVQSLMISKTLICTSIFHYDVTWFSEKKLSLIMKN